MRTVVRLAGVLAVLVAAAGLAPAANQKDIDAAVARGKAFLLERYKNHIPDGETHGIGPACLAGLALIECGTPIAEPGLKNIAAAVREASYSQNKTYQTALCVFFLDRLGEPEDVPRIQMLGARILAGMNAKGGWGYDSVQDIPAADQQRLRAMRPVPPDPKRGAQLHPDISAYYQTLAAANRNRETGDDNSNTQFAVLALWMCRKHGLPVDGALDIIENRFVTTQTATGGWGYFPGLGAGGSPSMTCCGMLALSTAVGRREEKRKAPPPKVAAPPKDGGKGGNDPFFNPPPPREPEKKGPKPLRDAVAPNIQAAVNNLGVALTTAARGPAGTLLRGNGHGHGDLYFLWSLERACVIFGIEKIAGIDWYDFGADAILPRQGQDGSWRAHYPVDVDTSFALLFLLKANLARDLSSRVKGEGFNELRTSAGAGSGLPGGAAATTPVPTKTESVPDLPLPKLPAPVDDETAKLATELVRATDWKKTLDKFRDTKGAEYTKALTAAVYRVEGERRKEARQALAERLTRMTAATLKTMMGGDDAELRRGAALAAAMKDDKSHIPDLIARLADNEEIVVRAAKAGLKSLTGQDLGPPNNASESQKQAAIVEWKAWQAKQKK